MVGLPGRQPAGQTKINLSIIERTYAVMMTSKKLSTARDLFR